MSCTNPLIFIDYGLLKNGKRDLRFLKRKRDDKGNPLLDMQDLKLLYGDRVVEIPCGKCESCIEARTRTWAARCVLEASCYKENCFLTLTYNDNSLPTYGLCKKDIQNFLKRLRKRIDKKIRYYCCGEYGEKTKRPHYHLIIFNWFPEDAKFFKYGNFGEGMLFTSKLLSELWPFGYSLVGECSYQSCGYVARYCQKKLYIEGKYKSFSMMSLKPGIGYKYLEDNFDKIYDTDKVYGNFGRSSFTTPFRYFDKVLESVNLELFDSIKNERINNAKLSIVSEMFRLGFSKVEQLYAYKGDLKKLKFDRLKRKEL